MNTETKTTLNDLVNSLNEKFATLCTPVEMKLVDEGTINLFTHEGKNIMRFENHGDISNESDWELHTITPMVESDYLTLYELGEIYRTFSNALLFI